MVVRGDIARMNGNRGVFILMVSILQGCGLRIVVIRSILTPFIVLACRFVVCSTVVSTSAAAAPLPALAMNNYGVDLGRCMC